MVANIAFYEGPAAAGVAKGRWQQQQLVKNAPFSEILVSSSCSTACQAMSETRMSISSGQQKQHGATRTDLLICTANESAAGSHL